MMERELDFARGYFTVFPWNFKDPKASKDEPYLWVSKTCPEDIKQRLLETWEVVKEQTKERHKNGRFSSRDYF